MNQTTLTVDVSPKDLRDAIRETLRVVSHDEENVQSADGMNVDIMFILLKSVEEAV